MKKASLILLVLVFIISGLSASTLEGNYDIKIKISNVKDSILYLGYHFGDQKYVKDTALIINDLAHFSGNETLPSGIYFIYSPSTYFELIVNESVISLETDTLDYIGNMKVLVSEENTLFNGFQKHMATEQRATNLIVEQINKLDQKTDTARINVLRNEILDIRDGIEAYQKGIVERNQGMFVAKMVNAMQKPKVPDPPKDENGVEDKNFRFFYYKDHFFDNFDLSDGALLRTPLYQPKVDEYMDKLTYQHPDSIAKGLDIILTMAEPNQETYRYLMVKLTNKYETSKIMGMERVFVYLAENYYMKGKAFWADDELVGKFSTRVKELKPTLVGNVAPDIKALDTLLRPVQLGKINSRFIILYFYDPDCGHCKKTTPVLYDLYKKIKDKGVKVFAACTVTDMEKWKKYIRDNDLNWINVADPYYKSNFRAEYDIKTTPQVFILDKKKEIIAKRLGVEQIEDFINRMIEFEES